MGEGRWKDVQKSVGEEREVEAVNKVEVSPGVTV